MVTNRRLLFLTVPLLLLPAAWGITSHHHHHARHNPSPTPFRPGFNISSVLTLATLLPSHSWEFGTASEALLEIYSPSLSVFGSSTPFLASHASPASVPALKYAKSKIVIGTGANGLSDGDGAVGDPASLGVFAVMLGGVYGDAARGEVEYLLGLHRGGGMERFRRGLTFLSFGVFFPPVLKMCRRGLMMGGRADFVYMAPPFLAFYGAATKNASVLQEAVRQCGLYREVLVVNETSGGYAGLWHHIVGPQSADKGLWSTGNGWAAAGMTRVLGTVMKAPQGLFGRGYGGKGGMTKEEAVRDLGVWIKEILDGAMRTSMDGGLLRNYLDDPSNSDGHGYGEVSGTAMLASVAYRVAVLLPKVFGREYVDWAEGVRGVIGHGGHVTGNGTVVPTVNPLNWGDTKPYTAGSPEGQCFVVLMYAAWRDCVYAGVCSAPE